VINSLACLQEGFASHRLPLSITVARIGTGVADALQVANHWETVPSRLFLLINHVSKWYQTSGVYKAVPCGPCPSPSISSRHDAPLSCPNGPADTTRKAELHIFTIMACVEEHGRSGVPCSKLFVDGSRSQTRVGRWFMYSCQAVPAAVTRDPGTVHSYSTHLDVNQFILPSSIAANLIRVDLLLLMI
jgi:hypothetical protein